MFCERTIFAGARKGGAFTCPGPGAHGFIIRPCSEVLSVGRDNLGSIPRRLLFRPLRLRPALKRTRVKPGNVCNVCLISSLKDLSPPSTNSPLEGTQELYSHHDWATIKILFKAVWATSFDIISKFMCKIHKHFFILTAHPGYV